MSARDRKGSPLVCIDCRYIRERPSGVATIVQALVDYLPEMAPDLRFLLLKHALAPQRISPADNVREVVVKAEANGPATLFWLPALADLRGVDLFHATFGLLPHWLTMATVVTQTDIMWLRQWRWVASPGPWRYVEYPFHRYGLWSAIRRATRTIAISEATQSEIGLWAPEAVSRVRVVLEGVSQDFAPPSDPAQAAAEAERVRKRYAPDARRFVLTVGQFQPNKNHETVLRAFARAFADEPDVHLLLVQRLGKGPKHLAPIAADLGVASRVHFLKNVPFTDLVRLYNSALIYCHPSLGEGFGNGPAEAMAAGCPVVTSDRSSMPEVAAGAACLVDPFSVESVANGLRSVAADAALRAQMREKGLTRAKQLSWRACAEGTLAVYREILGPPR